MNKTVLEINHLQKTYLKQEQPALKNLSFTVREDEHLGIIGANGSGKTTLFKLLLNLLRPDHGEIRIMGESDLEAARRHLGYVPEHQRGLENFTPAELLFLSARMCQLPPEAARKRRDELLEWAQLQKQRDELVAGFSKGMMQRLQLALALVRRPKILLLDEAMSGLDPAGQKKLRELLLTLQNTTLLYGSHNLSDVELFCRRAIILHQGEIRQDLIFDQMDEEIFTIVAEPAIQGVFEAFPSIRIRETWPDAERVKIELRVNQATLQEILAACREKAVRIWRINSRSVLEDLFEKYVKAE
ncbi:MAG TPA: ABC transporter ATP-binding protein [Caldithrix sp.]|nr:ABC transporter ATP-binding protein [Caldithrix sp.]